MYKEIIENRGITRLCHFTKAKNLPFILGNGEDSSNGIVANNFIEDTSFLQKIDEQRYDQHEDYICTSVQYPNCLYFSTVQNKRKKDLFREWVILEIDPNVINDTTKFCPVNAATKGGRLIEAGEEGFESLFAGMVEGKRIIQRNMFRPSNLPTDIQAEVLIYESVLKDYIKGIIFPNETRAFQECVRLDLCGIDVENYEIICSEEMFDRKELLSHLEMGEIPEERILEREEYGL